MLSNYANIQFELYLDNQYNLNSLFKKQFE